MAEPQVDHVASLDAFYGGVMPQMVGTVFGKNTQALCQIIKIRFFVFFEG
jgi:hypothetical protein